MKLLKNRVFVAFICCIISSILVFVIAPLYNGAITAQTEIIIAAQYIPAGTKINKLNTKKISVGNYNLPTEIIKIDTDCYDKYAKSDIYENEYIMSSKLSDKEAMQDNYLVNNEKGLLSVSITINSFASGMSGKLRTNDIISVFYADKNVNSSLTELRQELLYVKVLAVTTASGQDFNGYIFTEDETNTKLETVTLQVTKEQAKILTAMEYNGTIHLALVVRGNEQPETATALLEEQKIILQNIPDSQESIIFSEDNDGETPIEIIE